jgi:TonB family protein
MLKRVILALFIAAALPGLPPALAKPVETLARSGKWIVDYDQDACHLLAQFGTGKGEVVMRMTRYDLGPSFKLSLYGARFDAYSVRGLAKLDFGLGGKPIETGGMSGSVGETKAIFLSNVRLDGWKPGAPGETGPTITAAQEAAVSGMTVQIAGKKPFRLEFGSLGSPFAQLRSCQADLVKSWGYDPAEQAALSRRIKQINGFRDWLKSSDYPDEATSKGYNGLVQIRLDVDPAGQVAGCRVLNRTNPDVFADLTCRAVTKRAKFQPALDAQGRPVRAFEVYSIVWVMED